MKHLTSALLTVAVLSLAAVAFAYFSRPSQAQARGTDVQMLSFPMRSGVYYQPGKEYDEEQQLERYFSQGYELEAVIEPTASNGRPVVIFRR